MRYDQLMIVTAAPAAVAPPTTDYAQLVEKVNAQTSVINKLMSSLSSATEREIPEQLENSILNDEQAGLILEELVRIESEYFTEELPDEKIKTVPLNRSIVTEFLYNVPFEVYKAINSCVNNREKFPDVLNPAMLLYLLMAEDPFGAIGLWMQTISTMIDDNREVVDNDAQEYLADVLADDDEETDTDDEEDLGDAEGMSPGEYVEIDNEAALEAQAIADENLESETDVPDDDFVEVDPDAVDVIVDDDYEVVPIDPAQEDGEIPYDE